MSRQAIVLVVSVVPVPSAFSGPFLSVLCGAQKLTRVCLASVKQHASLAFLAFLAFLPLTTAATATTMPQPYPAGRKPVCY